MDHSQNQRQGRGATGMYLERTQCRNKRCCAPPFIFASLRLRVCLPHNVVRNVRVRPQMHVKVREDSPRTKNAASTAKLLQIAVRTRMRQTTRQSLSIAFDPFWWQIMARRVVWRRFAVAFGPEMLLPPDNPLQLPRRTAQNHGESRDNRFRTIFSANLNSALLFCVDLSVVFGPGMLLPPTIRCNCRN
jgi:hypothetical protein